MSATPRGIDVRQSGLGVLVRVGIDDASGNALGTGTATLRVCEYQNDGTLKQLDFADNTLKAATLTTPTTTLAAEAAPDGTTSGLWTKVLSTTQVGAFTAGNLYLALVTHSALTGVVIRREFQYGAIDGDTAVQTGDAFARLGAPIGASIAADIQTRSTYTGGDTPGTTTLLGRLTTGRSGNLDNLDLAVSSRLPTTSYTAPPSTSAIATAVMTDVSDLLGADITSTASGTAALLSRLGTPVTTIADAIAAVKADSGSTVATLAIYAELFAVGTVSDVGPTANGFVVSLPGLAPLPVANPFVGRQLCFTAAGMTPQKQFIASYALVSSTTAKLGFAIPFNAAPVNGASIAII